MSTSLAYTDKHLKPLPIRASVHHQDPLLYIGRQTKHIQRNLQVLIDAQSDGLLAGLSGPERDDTPSSESYTPTSSEPGSHQSRMTVPVRQPAAKKIGLRAAREGIFKSIYDLLKLREEERELLGMRDGERKDALIEIDEFSAKRTGLEEAISTIRSNDDSERSSGLKEEARTLEADIRELETKLYEMKAKHRHVLFEISEIENSVESKLSSYQASLSLLESNIRKYLQNPPLQPLSSTTDESTFYSLNPKRRTLDMAREHWTAEQEEVHKRQTEVEPEIQALEAGGGIWKQVITDVTGFEKRLRGDMRCSLQIQSQLLKPDGTENTKGDSVKAIFEDLEATTHRVEGHLDLAEERDWKLLVCCISAELEALREARGMLLDAFNVSEEDTRPPESKEPDHDDHDRRSNSPADPLGVDNPEPPEDLLRDTGERHDADTDDEPDPAWLLPES